MDQDLQQGVFFRTGFFNPLIEIVVARMRGKEFIEFRIQLDAFLGGLGFWRYARSLW